MQPDHEWLTPAEAAERLECGRQHVYWLGNTGRITRREVGGTSARPRWMYDARSVEKYRAAIHVMGIVRADMRRPA